MPSVLFICTANRCRSPMAMILLKEKLKILGVADDWRVESGGTWADEGLPAMEGAERVMAEKGYDLTDHFSRPLTAEMLRSFQVILTMESGQKEALQVEFPEIAPRVYLLSEMVGMTSDIRDPVGGPLSGYREVAGTIDLMIKNGFARISKLAQEEPVP